LSHQLPTPENQQKIFVLIGKDAPRHLPSIVSSALATAIIDFVTATIDPPPEQIFLMVQRIVWVTEKIVSVTETIFFPRKKSFRWFRASFLS
jgi:hypothetical protein